MHTRRTLTILALIPILAWSCSPSTGSDGLLQDGVEPVRQAAAVAVQSDPGELQAVLFNIPFFQYLTNSLLIALGTTVGSLVLGPWPLTASRASNSAGRRLCGS